MEILKITAMTPEQCTLHCMVGLPYSGKSTRAKELSEIGNMPIVCPDTIRVALHGKKFLPDAEPYVWAIAKTMVKALFMAGHPDVILDATNITQERRNEWLSKRWLTKFYHCATPVEICKERASKAGDTVMLEIIDKMAEQFDME